MAIALSVISIDYTRRKKRITYKPTFSGSYATGGDTLNFAAATNPSFLPDAYPSQVLPEMVHVDGMPGGNPAEFVKGTTNLIHKLKLFSAANTEVAAAAYNAAITGDGNVTLTASFPRA
jgi:hypothetical protein